MEVGGSIPAPQAHDDWSLIPISTGSATGHPVAHPVPSPPAVSLSLLGASGLPPAFAGGQPAGLRSPPGASLCEPGRFAHVSGLRSVSRSVKWKELQEG